MATDAERRHRMEEVARRSLERADDTLDRLHGYLSQRLEQLRRQGRKNAPGIDDELEPSGHQLEEES